LRDYDFREVKVARTIIEHSREVWLAADATKFNRQAMVELAHLSQIDRLFTDEPLRAPFEQIVADSGVKCVVAGE
ncbi:DeoR family transcriptional regulator, partial [Salmonella enterica]|nr:DeoR family transcriptional regulator [Salmonella enterica]